MNFSLISNYNFIYNKLSERELEGDGFCGFLSVDDDVKKALVELKKEQLTTGAYQVYQHGVHVGEVGVDDIDDKHKEINVTLKVDLTSKRIGPDYVICRDWNELLSYEEKIESPVDYVFFTSSGVSLSRNDNDQKFESYRSIGELCALIKKLAVATSGSSNTIFYGRALKFEFNLTEIDIDKPVDIEAISTLFSKDLHKEAITNLICSELVGFLKDKDSKVRFSYLVRHSSSFISNVLLSYQSYVENYNFEKVRKEYLEKRTEYIQKIYKVFDDISVKLLSIPGGIWFATNQIKEAGYGDPGLFKNLIVVVTVSCLVLILVLHVFGQFSVLRALKREYLELFDNLAAKFEDEAVKIKAVKEDLNSANHKVELKLYAAIISSLIMLVMAVMLFIVSFK